MLPDDGPEIERRQTRRQFRNFLILIAAVLGLTLGAIAAIRYWSGP